MDLRAIFKPTKILPNDNQGKTITNMITGVILSNVRTDSLA